MGQLDINKVVEGNIREVGQGRVESITLGSQLDHIREADSITLELSINLLLCTKLVHIKVGNYCS